MSSLPSGGRAPIALVALTAACPANLAVAGLEPLSLVALFAAQTSLVRGGPACEARAHLAETSLPARDTFWEFQGYKRPCERLQRHPQCPGATTHTVWDRVDETKSWSGRGSTPGERKQIQVCDSNRKPPCRLVTVCALPPEHQALAKADQWVAQTRGEIEGDIRSKGYDPAAFRFRWHRDTTPDTKACHVSWEATLFVDPSLVPRTVTTYGECMLPDPNISDCGADGVVRAARALPATAYPSTASNLRCRDGGDPAVLGRCVSGTLARLPSIPLSPTERAELRRVLVGKAQVLFELHGPQLAENEAPFGALYGVEGVQATCGPRLEVPTGTCPQLEGPLRELELCNRLTSGYAPVAHLETRLERCLDVARAIARLPASCRPTEWMEHARTLITPAVERVAGATVEPETNEGTQWPSHGVVRRRWGFINSYHLLFGHAPTAEDQLTKLIAKLWQRATEASSFGASATETDLATRGLELDRRVMLAALGRQPSEPAVLEGLPLLLLLSDGFRGLATRARSVTAIHDLACTILACRGSAGAEVEVLWQLWAALLTPAGLQSAHAAAVNLPGERPVLSHWQSVFDSLNRQSARIAQAQAAVMAKPTSLTRELAAFVAEADHRFRSYQATGLLDWTPAASTTARHLSSSAGTDSAMARLVAGLDVARATAKHKELQAQHKDFVRRVAQYESLQNSIFANWRSDLGASREELGVKEALGRRVVEVVHATTDLEGLRASAEVADARFGTFVQEFQAAVEASTANQEFQVQRLPPLTVSGRDARGFVGASAEAAAVMQGDKVWKLEVQKGDLVRFEVAGQWAPTCALRSVTLGGSDGQTPVRAPSDLRTTVEGYTLQWSGSAYEARGKAKRTAENENKQWDVSGSMCAGLTVSTPGAAKLVSPVDVYLKLEACARASYGRSATSSHETSESQGQEARDGIAGLRGVRAPGTPFFSRPAGSLVAVVSGGLGKERAHGLLQPTSTIVVEETGSLFLVVNDRPGCDDITDEALTVTPMVLRGAQGLGPKLQSAMVETLGALRAKSEGAVKQGALLPSETASLRAEALDRLRARLGMTVDQIPPSIASLFGAFLEAEVTGIERAVAIQTSSRAITLARRDIDALVADQTARGAESRLSQAWTRALLENVDATRLEHVTSEIVVHVRQEVWPLVELRTPGVARRLVEEQAASLRALKAIDLTSDGKRLAQQLAAFLADLDTVWSSELANLPTHSEHVQVMVGLVRPGKTSNGGYDNRMDGVRAAKLWNALEAREKLTTIDVRPEDLYRAFGGRFTLGCRRAHPVIEDVRLVFLTPEPAAHGEGLTVDATFGRELQFVDDVGSRRYLITRDDILVPQLPIGFAQTAAQARSGSMAYAGAGLSPFNRITVPLVPLYDPDYASVLAQSNEAVLAFRVSFLPIGRDVAVSVCTP